MNSVQMANVDHFKLHSTILGRTPFLRLIDGNSF